MTFKGNVPDTRNSKSRHFNELRSSGRVQVHDPLADRPRSNTNTHELVPMEACARDAVIRGRQTLNVARGWPFMTRLLKQEAASCST